MTQFHSARHNRRDGPVSGSGKRLRQEWRGGCGRVVRTRDRQSTLSSLACWFVPGFERIDEQINGLLSVLISQCLSDILQHSFFLRLNAL